MQNVNSNQSLKFLISISVFGALGGAFEISAGSLLHAFPFFPFRGQFLAGMMSVILISSAIYTGNKAAPFYTGFLIAFLKLLSPSHVILGPFISIIIESLLATAALYLFGNLKRISSIVAATAVCLWASMQKLIVQGIFLGMDIFKIYSDLISSFAETLHVNGSVLLWLLIPIILLHLAAGTLFGIAGYRLGQKLKLMTENNHD